MSSQGLLLDGGVALDAVVTPFGVEPVSSVTSVGTEIALTVPSVQTHPAPEFDETAMAAPADEADPDGFLTEAVKKTGTSIVRTGVKTGASIRDAVRAIGGAVRRAFPG